MGRHRPFAFRYSFISSWLVIKIQPSTVVNEASCGRRLTLSLLGNIVLIVKEKLASLQPDKVKIIAKLHEQMHYPTTFKSVSHQM